MLQPDGSFIEIDRTDELVERFNAAGLDALITVGGDGSLSIGYALAQKGLRVVGVPKTIDNDLDRTVMTFGFDTAVSFATECMDRLHTTATSRSKPRATSASASGTKGTHPQRSVEPGSGAGAFRRRPVAYAFTPPPGPARLILVHAKYTGTPSRTMPSPGQV